VLVFKKCRRNPDNILFIDASQAFDKVKTQNILRPAHIHKIVEAYLARIDQDKFSHVASLEAIKANDYNLNIPRYVDTFEAEAEIDLNVIAGQLKALEVQSQQTDATIAAFCRELGIAPPFAESGK
jgi:type I restriction enzyme M protein